MTTRTLVRAGGAALLLMMIVAAGVIAWRIDVIRMGGPIQLRSQQTSDLIADVLPPPAYIIEAYLEATFLLKDPAGAPVAAKRLAKLHDEYRTRLDHWAQSNIDPAVYAALTASKPPADAFWAEVETRYLPAARARDQRAMTNSYARIKRDYAAHRAAIDILVAKATDYQHRLGAQAAATLRGALVLLSIIGAIIVGGVAACCMMLLRHVISPIVALSTVTSALARGEPATVPFLDRADELGSIATAVESFRAATAARAIADAAAASEQRIIAEGLAQVLRTMADGDLSEDTKIDLPPSHRQVSENLNRAIATLRAMIKIVAETVIDLDGGATDIASASNELARRTEGAAASLEQASAALTQIDARLRSAATVSTDTVSRADSALATVASGRSTAEDGVQAMARVADAAKGTDAVIEGLDKIAFQTRVLAMNAAVEAGRAGDAGRGFAVVADLVSALAMRAEEEAKSARVQLTATQSEIITAVAAVERVDGALAQIAGNVGDVHALLGGMAEGNRAQSVALSEVAAAVEEMDRLTQQNAAMVEETSAAANNLSVSVHTLAEHAGAFRFDRRNRSVPFATERRAAGRRDADRPAPARDRKSAAPALF